MAQESSWIHTPIPKVLGTSTALDYHQIPIDITCPSAKEALLDAKGAGLSVESYYARTDGQNSPYFQSMPHSLASVWCRAAVITALQKVNVALAPFGWELLLLDGYRPVELQKSLWDFFINIAKSSIENPSTEACEAFVGQYWSDPRKFDPVDFTTWPTHATGGAIDLTLRSLRTKQWAYMGGIFDDSSELSHSAYFENIESHASLSHREALKNRRILYHAMSAEGFVNYPYEWWHFDFGTQMAVMNSKALPATKFHHRAVYGYIEPPVNIQGL